MESVVMQSETEIFRCSLTFITGPRHHRARHRVLTIKFAFHRRIFFFHRREIIITSRLPRSTISCTHDVSKNSRMTQQAMDNSNSSFLQKKFHLRIRKFIQRKKRYEEISLLDYFRIKLRIPQFARCEKNR